MEQSKENPLSPQSLVSPLETVLSSSSISSHLAMGGDTFFPSVSSSEEEESLLGHDSRHEQVKSGVSNSRDEEHLNCHFENDSEINGESGSSVGQSSPISKAMEKQRVKVYADVLRSYMELNSRLDRLEEAKTRILSYRPGLWAETAGGVNMTEYLIPGITSLLLVGPKGSGKSTLINKISRVFENNVFPSERAQVSNNSGEGTYFLHEYTVPRGSQSFCLYDTRGLSGDSSENMKKLKSWMTKGVRHGELVTRKSDNAALKALLKCRNRTRSSTSQFRTVNFVIFVVNGLSVLEFIDGDDEKKRQCSQMIATNFNNLLFFFKDDKPVVVVTHGDVLPIHDRVRIRVFLGDLLGIPPTGQIFDIPENDDPATQLTIVDMLAYCLERADRNLPSKKHFDPKVLRYAVASFLFWVVIIMATFLCIGKMHEALAANPAMKVEIREASASLIHKSPAASPSVKVKTREAPAGPQLTKFEWHKIRHCWLEE